MSANMLWRFFGTPSESFSSAEEASVNRLASAKHQAAGQDIKSAAGVDSCAAYLVAVEATATQLQIQPAPRAYRTSFPLNYRSLFPSEARSYRADVLEASLEHYNVIWVNGEKFEFTAEATQRAEQLQLAWIELGTVLDRWSRSPSTPNRGAQSPRSLRPTRTELSTVLKALDSAWANFEERYISELVQIEVKARSHIVQAIEQERQLQQMEKEYGENVWDVTEYREVQRRLVASITLLNSVANVNRKGRDDLRVEVLIEAHAAIRKYDESSGKDNLNILRAAKVLATDVMESFNAMRQYLCEVANCLERVDPHLGNNCGLVSRLVDWEESWEVGTAYLQQKRMLHALCDAVAEIHRVQELAPRLADMCEECDVELFMVLPRLIWLRFLSEPSQQMPLLARLLPHRFGAASSASPTLGAELQALFHRYNEVFFSLVNLRPDFERSSEECFVAARTMLAKRVISDDEEVSFVYVGMPPAHADKAKEQVEALMHELEAWSIELQRHCPEDWNQYSAVLVHCLRTEAEKERKGPFGV